MKRTKIITAFLLCACLIVGVGYAALSDVMDVTGTTTYNQDTALDALVYFQDPGKSNEDNNIQLIDGNHDKVSFNINSLAQINGKTYFWVKIMNDSEEEVTVNFKEYSANSHGQAYYKMSYYMGELASDPTTNDITPVTAIDSASSFQDLAQQGELYDANEHDPMTIPEGEYRYLCVKVTLTGAEDPETHVFSMPSGQTISATFNFEIDVTTAP